MNRFLQSMQEREAERLKRESQKVSVQAAEREEFSNQLGSYEKKVKSFLQEGHIHDAELTLGSLRSFVQDAVQTLSLTSYDMARANATVAKLQHEIDDAIRSHRIERSETEQKCESADQHFEQKEIEEEPSTICINEHNNKETANNGESTLEESNNTLNSSSVLNINNDTTNKNNTCINSSSSTTNLTSKQDGCQDSSKHEIHNTHKKFSFSSRCKTKMENKNINANTVRNEQKVDNYTVSLMDKTNDMSVASSQAKCYGPLVNETITIPPAKAIFVNECTHCTILTFPIAGSAFISNCRECSVYLACHQLRMKDCENVEVYVACTSHPIIEHCNDMRFGPYSCWTGLLMSSVELTKPQNVKDHSPTAVEETPKNVCCCNDTIAENSACDSNNDDLTTISNTTTNEVHNGDSINKEVTSKQILNAPQNISFTSLEEWLMYIGGVRNVTDALMNYNCVDDFQWLKKIASPHWRCLSNRDEMTMNSTVAMVTVDDESIIEAALIYKYKEDANRITDIDCKEEDDDVKVDGNITKSNDKCR